MASSVGPPDLDEVIEEGGPAAHVGQGRGGGVIDIGVAGAELVPVDARGDGRPGPRGAGQGDAGEEAAGWAECLTLTR